MRPLSFLGEANLTKAQRERIAALQKKHFLETAPLRQKLMEAVFAYRQTQVLEPENEASLAAKREAVKEAHKALRQKATESRAELLEILTPEQQEKLRASGLGKWGGRKGCRRGGGCGRW